MYAPIVTETATSFELSPPTVLELSERIARTLASLPWLVREVDGRVVGYAYAAPHRTRGPYQWAVETSVFVAARARGAGHGTALYRALLRLLGLQGFHRAFAGVTLPNAASVRLHRALGFEDVGVFRRVGFKQGRWHDVAWYQRSLVGATHRPPTPPTLLGDCYPEGAVMEGARVGDVERRLQRF